MPSSRTKAIAVGSISAIWLIGAPVAAHFVWHEAPWILVLVFAGMAELIVLTLWLVGSTLHDPVRRWELPPNPADAHRGWRGTLARMRAWAQALGPWLRQSLLRKPAKA